MHSPFFKVYLSLYLLLAILLIGVVGYRLIEGYSLLDALYMTVITLATVGFMEVEPLSPAGRIFTIFLILSGMVIFAYFLTQVSRYFLDGEFITFYHKYKMKKEIAQLKGHVIICGFGRNGREASRILTKNNFRVVVIESDEQKSESAAENQNLLVLHADGTRDESMIEANLSGAAAILTTLPDDAQNVFVCLTARELNPGIKIIARATHLSSVRKLKNAGADNVIMPDKIGGAHMAMLVQNPDIEEFIDIMATHAQDDFSIQEVLAGKKTTLAEADCWRRTGATIIGIKSTRNQYILNPSAELSIYPGDGIIIMGSKTQIDASKELFK